MSCRAATIAKQPRRYAALYSAQLSTFQWLAVLCSGRTNTNRPAATFLKNNSFVPECLDLRSLNTSSSGSEPHIGTISIYRVGEKFLCARLLGRSCSQCRHTEQKPQVRNHIGILEAWPTKSQTISPSEATCANGATHSSKQALALPFHPAATTMTGSIPSVTTHTTNATSINFG